MNSVLHIKQDLGAPLIVRLVAVAQRHDQIRQLACPADEPLVEFYDASFVKEPGYQPYGQYIGSQCKGKISKSAAQDLIVNSRVPQWFVEKNSLIQIINWLDKQSS